MESGIRFLPVPEPPAALPRGAGTPALSDPRVLDTRKDTCTPRIGGDNSGDVARIPLSQAMFNGFAIRYWLLRAGVKSKPKSVASPAAPRPPLPRGAGTPALSDPSPSARICSALGQSGDTA